MVIEEGGALEGCREAAGWRPGWLVQIGTQSLQLMVTQTQKLEALGGTVGMRDSG